jgi:hypothetical protein
MVILKGLIKIVLLNFVFLCVLNYNAISQNDSIFVYKNRIIVNRDYLIKTQKLLFGINDTIVESDVCIRPNGSLEFLYSAENRKNFKIGKSIHKGDTIINLTEKYVQRNTDTIFLESYFPTLLTHDSSLLNYSEYPFDSSKLFNYEMKYSTVLSNFSKPRIIDYEADTVIRIILPTESLYDPPSFFSYSPIPYSILELTIHNGEGILNYSNGYYDSLQEFRVATNKSCKIDKEELKKTIKRFQKVDFDKEYYTAVIGLIEIENYFIEIKTIDKYFALERALHFGIEKGIKRRDYPKQKHISKLYMEILGLQTKFLN